MRFVIATMAVVLGFVALVMGADAPDLSTPKGAERAFILGLLHGSSEEMKATTSVDANWQKVVEQWAASRRAQDKMRAAAVAKWGNSLGEAFPAFNTDEMTELVYKTDEDRTVAMLGNSPFRVYRKVDGKWKVDLAASLPDSTAAKQLHLVMGEEKLAMETTKNIEAGKYQNAGEAYEAYDGGLMKIIGELDDGATTAPATKPD